MKALMAFGIGCCWILAGVAAAQDTSPAPSTAKPSAKSAQIEAGEPRAATSPAPPSSSAAAAAPDRPAVPASPAATPTSGAARPGTARGAVKPAKSGAADRLDLGTATVTGDREQPKVMYIVPWKSADIGDLSGKPLNSLLDEALAPVDRDEFRREVTYYGAVTAPHPSQGEK